MAALFICLGASFKEFQIRRGLGRANTRLASRHFFVF